MRVLCFGDSNTYGFDPRDFFGGRYDANNRWPELLSNMTGWEIINQGVNGREIPHSTSPLPFGANASADIILVMLGSNDLLQGADSRDAAARMESFLNSLLHQYKNILLVAPPPMRRGAWVPTDALVTESIQLAEEYRLLAEKLSISFVDTRDWNIELCFDGVHFTEAGHHTFAEHFYRYLVGLS